MIDDQQLGRGRFLSCRVEEAAVVFRAASAQAVVVLGDEGFPGVGSRHERKIRERPVTRRVRPLEDRGDLSVERFVQREARRGAHLGGLAQAKVVAAPFDERRAKRHAQVSGEQRKIDANQLLLQVDRVRRDDDALALRTAPVDRRDEIRERLAGARAGFDHEDAALRECLRDPLRHADLLATVFVTGKRPRDRPARAELRGDRRGIEGGTAQPSSTQCSRRVLTRPMRRALAKPCARRSSSSRSA